LDFALGSAAIYLRGRASGGYVSSRAEHAGEEGHHAYARDGVGRSRRGFAIVVLAGALWSTLCGADALAGGPQPCGNETAPACNGTCPAGTRCVSLVDGTLSMAGLGPQSGQSPSPDQGATGTVAGAQCGCQIVLCGGVPIDNTQSCCNGVPFTLGSQGCCRGAVVPANTPCDCNGMYDVVDFAGDGKPPPNISFPADNCCANTSVFASAGPANQTGCCLRNGLAVEYTLNAGFDCCPQSGPDFCFGDCERGQCVSDNCCECTSCAGDSAQLCKLPASTLEFCSEFLNCATSVTQGPVLQETACFIECFLVGPTCDESALVEDASCSGNGCLSNVTAEAPAASSAGLVLAVLALVAVATVAIMRARA